MGLKDGSKGVFTPSVKTKFEEGDKELDELPTREASKFRGLVARGNYVGQDRSDIKYAVKELSRRMAKPRYRDVEALKRLARYLVGKPRMINRFDRQEMPKGIEGWSDSDWAGCLETRKSTSGGLIMFGKHMIKSWSVTQAVLVLSSGEAEFYALVKTASQGLGLRAMLEDMGIRMKLKIIDKKIRFKTDASAAKGMALRRGLGPVRHIEVNQLWIQDKVLTGEIGIEKIGGKTNLADALTKHAEASSLNTHIEGVGLEMRSGRHAEAIETVGEEVIEDLQFDKRQETNENEYIGHMNCIVGISTNDNRCAIEPNSNENPCCRRLARAPGDIRLPEYEQSEKCMAASSSGGDADMRSSSAKRFWRPDNRN